MSVGDSINPLNGFLFGEQLGDSMPVLVRRSVGSFSQSAGSHSAVTRQSLGSQSNTRFRRVTCMSCTQDAQKIQTGLRSTRPLFVGARAKSSRLKQVFSWQVLELLGLNVQAGHVLIQLAHLFRQHFAQPPSSRSKQASGVGHHR